MNHHRALGCCLRMISAQTRSAFVARENRFALLRIMLQGAGPERMQSHAAAEIQRSLNARSA
jgi:hypothetical protein